MLRNYIKIALRNIAKYKVFSFINMMGMAVSLASCLLIALFVWDELQYDRHHPDGDRTFRIYNIVNHDGVESYFPILPYPFASYMQKDFQEIESTLRMIDTYRETLFEKGDAKLLEPSGFYAEPAVFDMLTLNVVSGQAQTALTRPNTIALSASLAKKYFDDKSALGEIIKVDHRPYEITAVFADPPQHFHLKVSYLLSFASTDWSTTHENNWQRQQIYTYLKLKPGANASALEAKFKPFVEKYAYPTIQPKGITYVPYLQNIRDIHLHSSNFEWEVAQRGSALSVYILSGTAVMILVIACLNFVNLSTARALKRMKEVGIRKVVGAHRKQLVFQFMTESIVFTLFGLFLAVVFAELALPSLNGIVGKQFHLPYEINYVIGTIVFVIALGILAGSYPALQLSRFKPALVLYKMKEAKGGAAFFRQSLVVFQFMLSFFLLSGAWTVLSQNDLLLNKNLGFDKEQIVVVPLTTAQLKHQETTKQKYSNHQNVMSATIGFGLPGDVIAGDDIINPEDGKTHPANLFCIDFDYVSTMGMKIIAGRDFSRKFQTDSSEAFILNESALSTYGLGTPEEAIGKRLQWKQWHNNAIKNGRIIGVVRDFNFKSLRDKMSPVVMHIYPQAAWKLALRIKPENKEETIAHFKKTYESLESDWIFTYSFLDENFDDMYKSEQQLGKLFSIFTYLAIIVTCLGLFGLVEFSVGQRAKEISIRKIFGANVASLLVLLTRQYLVMMIIACLVVTPAIYFFVQQWLSNFAYRTDIDVWLFVKAAEVILTITLVTVSFQSIKASLTNPVENLKNE